MALKMIKWKQQESNTVYQLSREPSWFLHLSDGNVSLQQNTGISLNLSSCHCISLTFEILNKTEKTGAQNAPLKGPIAATSYTQTQWKTGAEINSRLHGSNSRSDEIIQKWKRMSHEQTPDISVSFRFYNKRLLHSQLEASLRRNNRLDSYQAKGLGVPRREMGFN